jgi:ABC-2 type transport system permease protein
MTAYRALISARFRMHLQYRAAALAGLGTQLFWGLIRIFIFAAFFRSSDSPQPMTYPQVVTYIWLSQALMRLIPWYAGDPDVRAAIRTGSVAYELLRPVDLYWTWFVRIIGATLAETALRAIPMFIVAGLFLGLQAPPSWPSAGAWALAMIGVVLLGGAMVTLLSITMMWTISGEGVTYIAPTLAIVFSGMIVPLPFFPDWAQPVLNALPFRGLIDIPFRLYMGHLSSREALPMFAQQMAWTIALVALGRLLLARGTRRLVVQGG